MTEKVSKFDDSFIVEKLKNRNLDKQMFQIFWKIEKKNQICQNIFTDCCEDNLFYRTFRKRKLSLFESDVKNWGFR